ncbi:fumarylacetoacetate hydrolase family protein [Bradyrhizobium sp. 4]|uniref:fumarylacetoacetate hydrolase family protein n=1 Tax=unclassified Bradyrhizobium TaxID=2631580 RepID=UPI001FFAA5B1|nr:MULTISPECIES: fumarylacetoacetate hydrolase family protein [unclassified Bradyrhizobium]MCK1396796.1 fumarylacetoacetate hydrolase family protein [Bradyrhizobium sp. 39]MCK1520081.1 fumarylacetoacetate hydrolase family protein [Bradyrhizobium sp. 17]MCK1635229.1 fumarylacetoacetate hydrolase family protein [Bradyrhizobium sp. 162]MCK1752243.1 fumarylacetoacetate hydrolase family protein [Bradyrhizobium sp. 135]UPJ36330.1 fumarylacetoacetate hydrolase family protein [Bradyrhizobium sp. 4]
MKLFCARLRDTVRVGVLSGDEAVLLPQRFGDLLEIIEAGEEALEEIRRVASEASAERMPFADLSLLSPIRRFRRDVLCVGWNYLDHFNEGREKRAPQAAKELPKAPTFFTKSPYTVIGPRDAIAYDARLSGEWDYEAELAIIIGRAGRSIPEKDVRNHIFGYSLANDISVRDMQRKHGGQWFKGKSMDGTMPLGPYIVTGDEMDLPAVRLQCLVNGELRQDASISQMAFPIERLIAEISLGMTLQPGDVLLTGTPSGVGYARTPPLFLKEGDEVLVRATGLGELRNRLVHTDLLGCSDVKI